MINSPKGWKALQEWLVQEREVALPRGSLFKATYDRGAHEITIVPTRTGIERRVSSDEWNRFVNKFNSVEESGYDPMRPGHYARVTFNSSYLVALIREVGVRKM